MSEINGNRLHLRNNLPGKAEPQWRTDRDRAQAEVLTEVIAELNTGLVSGMGCHFCAFGVAVTLALTGGVCGWVWATVIGSVLIGFILASIGRTSVVLDGLEARKKRLEDKE